MKPNTQLQTSGSRYSPLDARRLRGGRGVQGGPGLSRKGSGVGGFMQVQKTPQSWDGGGGVHGVQGVWGGLTVLDPDPRLLDPVVGSGNKAMGTSPLLTFRSWCRTWGSIITIKSS